MTAAEGLLWLACFLIGGIVFGYDAATRARSASRDIGAHIAQALELIDIDRWEHELGGDR